MRNITMTVLAVLTALIITVLPSCTVDGSQERYVDVVEEGYKAYQAVRSYSVEPVIRMLDMTLKADRWLRSGSDEERNAVAERLMYADGSDTVFHNPGMRYIELGDFEIHYADESILSPGSSWKCTLGGIECEIRCIWETMWEVEVMSGRMGSGRNITSMIFYAVTEDLGLMDFDWEEPVEDGESKIMLSYLFETEGVYTEELEINGSDTFTELTFITEESAAASVRPYGLLPVYGGVLSIHMTVDGPVERDEDIRVTLSGSAVFPRVIVEYMGMKKHWVG